MSVAANSHDSVLLAAPPEAGNPAFIRLSHAVRQSVPDATVITQPSEMIMPQLLLVSVDDQVDTGLIERTRQGWISGGSGTVVRLPDGDLASRIIPISAKQGVTVPEVLKFYLDGTDYKVQVPGDVGSPDQQSFSYRVTRLLAAGRSGPASQPDCQGLETFIRARFRNEFPPLAYHNPEHIQDVYESALRIADAETVNAEGKDLIRVAALFHDAGFIHTVEQHEARGADMAASVMPAFGFTTEHISVVRQMILSTRVPQQPVSLLDRIICDADLDYLGRDDFYTTGGRLFRELLDTGVVKDERGWNSLQKKFLEAHRYHTEFSRKNREPGKQARLLEISAMVGTA